MLQVIWGQAERQHIEILVYMYICIGSSYIHMCLYMFIYVHMFIYIYIYVYMCIHIYICIHPFGNILKERKLKFS